MATVAQEAARAAGYVGRGVPMFAYRVTLPAFNGKPGVELPDLAQVITAIEEQAFMLANLTVEYDERAGRQVAVLLFRRPRT